MLEFLIAGLAAGVWVLALGVWVWWHWGCSAEGPKGDPVVAVPVPPAEPVVKVEPVRGKAPEPWRVEFVSGSGRRILGRERRGERRPATITYRGMDGLTGSFVQDHQKPDGTWVYRRVSVER